MRPVGGGVQVREPASSATSPPSAVACASGLGCDWQAAAGVLAKDTVTVTEPPFAIVPKLQVSKLPAEMLQDPWPTVMLAPDQSSPPLVGSWSLSLALVASLPPSLLTTMVKLTAPPWLNFPPSGVLTTFRCGGTVQV